jgi:hypothetical protein
MPKTISFAKYVSKTYVKIDKTLLPLGLLLYNVWGMVRYPASLKSMRNFVLLRRWAIECVLAG